MNFGINKSQKMLLLEVTKLPELLLILPTTKATSERSFLAVKRIKTYLRSTTSGNRLNNIMLLHDHCKKSLTNLTRLQLRID